MRRQAEVHTDDTGLRYTSQTRSKTTDNWPGNRARSTTSESNSSVIPAINNRLQKSGDDAIFSNDSYFFFCERTDLSLTPEGQCRLSAISKSGNARIPTDLFAERPVDQFQMSSDGRTLIFVDQERILLIDALTLDILQVHKNQDGIINGIITGYPQFVPCTVWKASKLFIVRQYDLAAQNGLGTCLDTAIQEIEFDLSKLHVSFLQL